MRCWLLCVLVVVCAVVCLALDPANSPLNTDAQSTFLAEKTQSSLSQANLSPEELTREKRGRWREQQRRERRQRGWRKRPKAKDVHHYYHALCFPSHGYAPGYSGYGYAPGYPPPAVPGSSNYNSMRNKIHVRPVFIMPGASIPPELQNNLTSGVTIPPGLKK